MRNKLMIIDDEISICISLSLALGENYSVAYSADPVESLERMRTESFDVVLLDLVIGEHDGIDVLKQIKQIDPQIAVIVMTAYGSIRSSVAAMKNGAFTYLSKPLDVEELQIYIKQALNFRELNEKVTYLNKEIKDRLGYGNLIRGESDQMKTVYAMIEKLKDVDAIVTITGESGTGKELVAKAIHFSGKRKDERFIPVNCAAIPEGLLEDEFFGHKRGAFTGAVNNTMGKFESAGNGTVFLDEIGDMPISLQGKLLRALQERAFTPIGSNDAKHFEARVIVATNRDLAEMVNEGSFRQDLYFRINVVEIKLPSLRSRKQDIPMLCDHFIRRNNDQQKKSIKGITREAQKVLLAHDYPGNVRELANVLEYACIVASGDWIDAIDLPDRIRDGRAAEFLPKKTLEDHIAGMTLHELEGAAVISSYKRNNGKRKAIAAELGISERGLWNKLHEYGLQ